MWTRALGVLVWSMVGFGIAVMPADAAESRVGFFAVA